MGVVMQEQEQSTRKRPRQKKRFLPVGLIFFTIVCLSNSIVTYFRGEVDSFAETDFSPRHLLLSPDNNTSEDTFCNYHDYPKSDRCEYAKADPDCTGERINYLAFYACASTSEQPLIMIFFFVLLFVLFYLLSTTADKYFCPQVEELTDRLKLTPRVAGVTLVSLGNGAPDVFAGINAIQQNKIGLVLGQLTGGGMFVSTVVAGGVIFVAGGIRTRFPLLRDIEMYFMLVVALTLMTWKSVLTYYTSAILLVYYMVFIGLAYYSDKKLLAKVNTEVPPQLSAVPMLEHSATQSDLLNQEYRIARHARMSMGNVLDHLSYNSEGNFKRTFLGYLTISLREFIGWCEAPFNVLRNLSVVNCVSEDWSVTANSRIKASIAVAGVPLFFGFWQDLLTNWIGSCPMWLFLGCLGIPAGLAFLATCPTDHPPSYSLLMILLGFVTAALWVDVLASQLVDLLAAIGNILSISPVTMGATVLAWGNCVGDLTADVLLARNKREGMAITACYAGPMFDLLMVIGFGVIIRTISSPIKTELTTQTLISFSFLASALFLSVAVALLHGKLSKHGGNRLPKEFAYVLWALYVTFVLTMIVFEFAGHSKTL